MLKRHAIPTVVDIRKIEVRLDSEHPGHRVRIDPVTRYLNSRIGSRAIATFWWPPVPCSSHTLPIDIPFSTQTVRCRHRRVAPPPALLNLSHVFAILKGVEEDREQRQFGVLPIGVAIERPDRYEVAVVACQFARRVIKHEHVLQSNAKMATHLFQIFQSLNLASFIIATRGAALADP